MRLIFSGHFSDYVMFLLHRGQEHIYTAQKGLQMLDFSSFPSLNNAGKRLTEVFYLFLLLPETGYILLVDLLTP